MLHPQVCDVLPGIFRLIELCIATVIPWERGELIAKGGSGRVYVARTITTGNIMAVKQYGAARAEVEVLKDLDHRNVVKYLGFEETPPTSSLFVEYVPGGSIGGLLRKFGSFDEHIVKSFAGQIIDGLAHLHSMGLVHRVCLICDDLHHIR